MRMSVNVDVSLKMGRMEILTTNTFRKHVNVTLLRPPKFLREFTPAFPNCAKAIIARVKGVCGIVIVEISNKESEH